MLTLEQLRVPSDEELAAFDLAEVDLACAVGLPGSERLDIPACLAWLDYAVAWTHRHTEGTFDEFLRHPERYDHSEGIFRVLAIDSVLRRGMGVRYNRERIETPGEFTDSRDDFINGMFEGRGGTCASLPTLYAAVGRRLGYPLKLVTAPLHQFARWDDPGGERFNIEISNAAGMDVHPDNHYLTWPVPMPGTDWRHRTRYLRSLTPREELAHTWSKRGFCWQSNGRLREAADSFATARSIATDDQGLDFCLGRLLEEWRLMLSPRVPAVTPQLRINFPLRRRYPGLPVEIERDIIALGVLEGLLNEPIPDVDCVVLRVPS